MVSSDSVERLFLNGDILGISIVWLLTLFKARCAFRLNLRLLQLRSLGCNSHASVGSESSRQASASVCHRTLLVFASPHSLAASALPAHLVIVKGTEYFDGKTSRYVDYPLTDILQMIGRAGRPGYSDEGKAVEMTMEAKKIFFKVSFAGYLTTPSLLVTLQIVGTLVSGRNSSTIRSLWNPV